MPRRRWVVGLLAAVASVPLMGQGRPQRTPRPGRTTPTPAPTRTATPTRTPRPSASPSPSPTRPAQRFTLYSYTGGAAFTVLPKGSA